MEPPYITHTIDVFVFKRPRSSSGPPLVNLSVCEDQKVQIPAGLDNFYCTGKLQVGPNRREAITVDEDVSALFVGDYALPRQLRDMTSKYILIPLLSSANGQPHEQIAGGPGVSRMAEPLTTLSGLACLVKLALLPH